MPEGIVRHIAAVETQTGGFGLRGRPRFNLTHDAFKKFDDIFDMVELGEVA